MFPGTSDAELGLTSFQLYRLHRYSLNSPYFLCGKVLIAINLLFKFSSVHFTVDNFEQIFAMVSLNTNTLLIGAIYIPPNTLFSVIESHVSTIEEILCGDYNIPYLIWSCNELGFSAIGDLILNSKHIVDSFSYLNFFKIHNILNTHDSIFNLIFSISGIPTAKEAATPIVIPDYYHPPLYNEYPYQTESIIDITHSYYGFKAGN